MYESGWRQRVPARLVPIHSPRPVTSFTAPGRSQSPPSGSMTTVESSDMYRTTLPSARTARDVSCASNLTAPPPALAVAAFPPAPAGEASTSGFFCVTVRSVDT